MARHVTGNSDRQGAGRGRREGQVRQGALPMFGQDTPRAIRKRVRAVSKRVYAELRDSGRLAKRAHEVLTALAYYRNRTQEWPTPAELVRDMAERGIIPREESRYVAPRLTEFVKGAVKRRKDGSTFRKGGGLCVLMPARTCRVSGQEAHPVAIREAGSQSVEVHQ